MERPDASRPQQPLPPDAAAGRTDAAARDPPPRCRDRAGGGGSAPGPGAPDLPVQATSFPFAAEGERTIARAYEHAFARATRLVYLEDQNLWSDVVARTLAEALRRSPRLQVIAVVPRFPGQDGRVSGPPNRLGQLTAMKLLTEAGGDRFAVYDLENDAGTPVYIHAKVCIVDDTWMTCGSDNFNRRSWTHDSELTCAVVDPDGLLPRRLRTALWSEHLGLPLDDPRLARRTRPRPRSPGSPTRNAAGNGSTSTTSCRPTPADLDFLIGSSGSEVSRESH